MMEYANNPDGRLVAVSGLFVRRLSSCPGLYLPGLGAITGNFSRYFDAKAEAEAN